MSPARSRLEPETRTVRAGVATDTQHGAVIPPIYPSSTYSFAGFREKRTYDYTRTANPTRDTLGTALADLEAGADAVVTPTGLSAVLLVLQLLRPEDRLVAHTTATVAPGGCSIPSRHDTTSGWNTSIRAMRPS